MIKKYTFLNSLFISKNPIGESCIIYLNMNNKKHERIDDLVSFESISLEKIKQKI